MLVRQESSGRQSSVLSQWQQSEGGLDGGDGDIPGERRDPAVFLQEDEAAGEGDPQPGRGGERQV